MKKLLLVGVCCLLASYTPAGAIQATCFTTNPTTGIETPCAADSAGNLLSTSQITNPSVSFNRPGNTTAYTQNTLVANSTNNTAVLLRRFNILTSTAAIPRIRVSTNITSGWDQSSFVIHLWSSLGYSYTNGDGGAYAVTAGTAQLLGVYTVTLNQLVDSAQGFGVPTAGTATWIQLPAGTTVVYYDIEYTGTVSLTPISGQTFTVTPEVVN